jgi:putative ABC transport system ATP-binding protein
VGYVFQMHHLVPVLTAWENVELPLLLLPLSKKERRDHVDAALEAVGLAHRSDHYPRQLSGGEEQRAAIARAIVTDPRIVVADEPTGDLDANGADAILELLQALSQRFEKTFVMVTHDHAAAAVADRILHLHQGSLRDGPLPVERQSVRGGA